MKKSSDIFGKFKIYENSTSFFCGRTEDIYVIFDGDGTYSPNDERPYYLLYTDFENSNFEKIKQYQKKLDIIKCKLNVDKIFIPNFKYIGPKIDIIDLNKVIYNKFNPDVGYGDGIIVIKNNNLFYEKIGVGGFVGDCAAIVCNYKQGLVGILHAGWTGTAKGVVKTFVDKLKDILGDNGSQKSLGKVEFFVSPMAGEDFELPVDLVKKEFANYIKRNQVDYNNFFEINKKKQTHGFLELREAIKIEFRNNNINPEKQIWFHPHNTTNLNNDWPSYRLHSKGLQPYNDRLAAFAII